MIKKYIHITLSELVEERRLVTPITITRVTKLISPLPMETHTFLKGSTLKVLDFSIGLCTFTIRNSLRPLYSLSE